MASREDEIRAVIDEHAAAIRLKDVELISNRVAAEVVSFDAVPPLTARGRDAVATRAREWFASYSSPIGYQVQDLEVHAVDGLAFCSFVYVVTGTLASGAEIRMAVRATHCFRHEDDRWILVHEHESVPFDPETGKAVLA